MYHNYVFDNVNTALPVLLNDLLEADEVGSRAGRTKELTHVGITLTRPWEREILLTERKASIAAQIAETMWVLSGRDDMEFLGHYLPRAKDFSDDGKTWRAGYGKRLRSWPKRDGSGDVIDQLRYVVDKLREHSTTRQAVMTIWDPTIDTNPGKDIPCNDWITFSNRLGQLDMHVGLRSNDAIWGWSGINAFEWSTMLEIVANLIGVKPGALHFSTTSFHLYDHHYGRARKLLTGEQVACMSASTPFDIGRDRSVDNFDALCERWFIIESQIRTGCVPSVEIQRAVDAFPEPMLRSWLRVIQWWWTGNRAYLSPIASTALGAATVVSVQPPAREQQASRNFLRTQRDLLAPRRGSASASSHNGGGILDVHWGRSSFLGFAISTHNAKHQAYGNSWKRRGEMLGILANIARKVDRLGAGRETDDETSADTAMDLMVYLAKYRAWLDDETKTDQPDSANQILLSLERALSECGNMSLSNRKATEERLRHDFDRLEHQVVNGRRKKVVGTVEGMLQDAYRLARHLWDETQVLELREYFDTDEYLGADHD